MGRKPNPLILEYFERGPKLNDNSNRYPHTCRLCGENFPKGRIDSLTSHITKRCPAISESERMRACLELHGIAHARTTAAERHQQLISRSSARSARSGGVVVVGSAALPPEWSALETLAEASRQVDLNENNRSDGGGQGTSNAAATVNGFEPHLDRQQQALDAAISHDVAAHDDVASHEAVSHQVPMADAHTATHQDGLPPDDDGTSSPSAAPQADADLTPEERLQALLPVSDESTSENPNLSVAVAAAARLNSAMFDPQLLAETRASPSPLPPTSSRDVVPTAAPSGSPAAITGPSSLGVTQPWGEMTYQARSPASPPVRTNPPPMIRGGVCMDTSGPMFNGRSRHHRSKFTPARRQEVKELRKLGACIRCRILRKICSKGTPCDTCRKVLSPRVWMTGCVRSRLHEQLDLYSAGVQVVLSQNRINLHKDQLQLTDVGSVLHVSHFPDTGKYITLPTLAVLLGPDEAEGTRTGGEGMASEAEPAPDLEPDPPPDDSSSTTIINTANKVYQVIMINQDKEDVPAKIDGYVREVLDLFIEREPSRFTRITLQTAMQQLAATEDELLRKALELWGLVESIDRERQWSIVEHPAASPPPPPPPTSTSTTRTTTTTSSNNDERHHDPPPSPRPILEAPQTDTGPNPPHMVDIYTMICMQLNAAAERRAHTTSRSLLNLMDRLLADSKTKAGFRVYLSALILLNCVEKSTWAFKAWEQDHLRPGWPLERDPGSFASQGGHLATLFRMLLGIRRALPLTARGEGGRLVVVGRDAEAVVVEYFEALDLEYDAVLQRQQVSDFSPTDSRSLELLFCSHLLLPQAAS